MEMFGVICGGAWRYLVEGIAANHARHRRKTCKAFPTEQCRHFQEKVNETKNAVNDFRKAVSLFGKTTVNHIRI
jgi:hypothetical protein